MGIEPTPSAWKAEVLPLNYARIIARNHCREIKLRATCSLSAAPLKKWWRGQDLNLRRRSRQIYSLIPLTTREPLQYFLAFQ